jgi:hypothetical protein
MGARARASVLLLSSLTAVLVLGFKLYPLDFLVQDGQIRVEALVRQIIVRRGVGLKFTAVRDADVAHLSALRDRLARSS